MNVNPIQSVNGQTVKCPSGYTASWEDVSASSAGRTEDAVMHTDKLGTARSFTFTWNNISFDDASTILKAFTTLENFSATVFDLELGEKANNYMITRTFYVGNRTSPVYNMGLEIVSNLTFKIISIGVN